LLSRDVLQSILFVKTLYEYALSYKSLTITVLLQNSTNTGMYETKNHADAERDESIALEMTPKIFG
jgi:hypothetical protein